jgi:hypothetical protein
VAKKPKLVGSQVFTFGVKYVMIKVGSKFEVGEKPANLAEWRKARR